MAERSSPELSRTSTGVKKNALEGQFESMGNQMQREGLKIGPCDELARYVFKRPRSVEVGKVCGGALAHHPATHQSGHWTFHGVRVAATTIFCSASVSWRSSRAMAASTIHGSSTTRAVLR